MILRKTQMGIMVLTVLVAASYWASRDQDDSKREPIRGLNTQLDYALQDFEYQLYDLEGLPSVLLTAPGLSSHAATGISEISRPVFNFIEGGISWEIVAESATVTPDREHIFLNGDVRIRRPASDLGGLLRLSTSELTIDLGQKVVSSDRPVTLTEGNDFMEAVGFRVNMMNNRFQLLNQVKLTYAVN